MKINIATSSQSPQGTTEDKLLADALRALDYTVIISDWRSLSIQASKPKDAVIIRSTWDYHLKLKEFLDWAQATAENAILLNPLDCILWNSTKKYFLEDWCQSIPRVPTILAETEPSTQALIETFKFSGEAILKPIVGASSFETHRVGSVAEALHAWKSVRKQSAVLIQPYISSVEGQGETSVICSYSKNEGWKALHAICKVPKGGDFRVQAEYGGSWRKITLDEKLQTQVMQVLHSLPVKPIYARIDFIETPSQRLLSEVELIEPALFLEAGPSLDAFAGAIDSSLKLV